ncbi:hypothetical protein ACFFRR_007038 [Megaselia abdita]
MMKEGTFLLQSPSSVVLLMGMLLVLLCASSSLCDKEVTHPAVFYKEDYVSADYDPTAVNLTSSENNPNGLLKSEKLVFDHLPNERHGRHHKRIRHYDEILKRHKRQALSDPNGVFSEQEQPKQKSNRQRRQYYQPYQPNYIQPYNSFNSWGSSSAYNGYYVTPNVVSFLPPSYNLPANYYLPVASNNNNNNNAKVPIRGIYYNPISVPGNFGAVRPNPPTVSVGNRIGDEPDYYEERPVWGVRYENVRPPSSAFTTRRPSTVSTPPPLLHGRDRPTQNTPPPLLHGRDRPTQPPFVNGRDNNPATPAPPATTRRPQVQTTQRPTTQELSKCVWAIVSCCSRGSTNVVYQCFEQMGCQGAFWGLNPCANEIQDEALDAADRYFD